MASIAIQIHRFFSVSTVHDLAFGEAFSVSLPDCHQAYVPPRISENQPRRNEERDDFLTFLRALRFFVVDFPERPA
jgi:hypothetical protein